MLQFSVICTGVHEAKMEREACRRVASETARGGEACEHCR